MTTMQMAGSQQFGGLVEARKIVNITGKTLVVIGMMNGNETCYFPNLLTPRELGELKDFLNEQNLPRFGSIQS